MNSKFQIQNKELIDDRVRKECGIQREAYGLVYLEAMARGCITIASRDEGFDGVIKDGINGFCLRSVIR